MITYENFHRDSVSRVRKSCRRGSMVVELALVLPILLLLMCGIVQYSFLMHSELTLCNIARDTARYAAVHGLDVTADDKSWPVPTANGQTMSIYQYGWSLGKFNLASTWTPTTGTVSQPNGVAIDIYTINVVNGNPVEALDENHTSSTPRTPQQAIDIHAAYNFNNRIFFGPTIVPGLSAFSGTQTRKAVFFLEPL